MLSVAQIRTGTFTLNVARVLRESSRAFRIRISVYSLVAIFPPHLFLSFARGQLVTFRRGVTPTLRNAAA